MGEFDDFEAEFRAKQAPDAPSHPYRDDFAAVEAEFRERAATVEPEPGILRRAAGAIVNPAAAIFGKERVDEHLGLAAKSLGSGFATVGKGLGAGLEIAGADDIATAGFGCGVSAFGDFG